MTGKRNWIAVSIVGGMIATLIAKKTIAVSIAGKGIGWLYRYEAELNHCIDGR